MEEDFKNQQASSSGGRPSVRVSGLRSSLFCQPV